MNVGGGAEIAAELVSCGGDSLGQSRDSEPVHYCTVRQLGQLGQDTWPAGHLHLKYMIQNMIQQTHPTAIVFFIVHL